MIEFDDPARQLGVDPFANALELGRGLGHPHRIFALHGLEIDPASG